MSIDNARSQRILFLDIEGVMTRGYIRTLSFIASSRNVRDADYSREATGYVKRLCEEYGFKIVLITRHDRNDGETLQKRLDFAGIEPQWLYGQDPEAIAEGSQHKGDCIMDWLRKPSQRHICIENTVAVDDLGIRTGEGRVPYPKDRVVMPVTEKGIQYADFVKIVDLVGDVVPEVMQARSAIPRQLRQALQAR